MADFEPFDRAARRRARDRAARLIANRAQVLLHVEAGITERAALAGDVPEGPEARLGLLLPPPAGAIGVDPSETLAHRHRGIAADEDRLPLADAAFARITALMLLHGVNDLPGALILCRRALRPGGLFLAVFPAGQALAAVRAAFLNADIAAGRGVAPRVGPTVDPVEAAGLLQRAGFADPVVEMEPLDLRYTSLESVARDVRAHGDSGWLASRARGLTTPRRWAAAEAAFQAGADADGRVRVEVPLIWLTARAPAAQGMASR